VSVVDILQARS